MSRTVPSLAGRVRESVERDGLRRTAARAARRIASPVVEAGALVFFARELEPGSEPSSESISESISEGAGREGPRELLPPGAQRHGYRVREALPSELPAVREGSDPGRSEETLRDRFRRGHLCFVAVNGEGTVGHVRWVTTEAPHVPELRRSLLLAPGDAYFYDGYTRPEARRRGLDGLVRSAIFRALRERGYRRAVSYVRSDNPAGLRAAARWERPVGRVRWVRLGPPGDRGRGPARTWIFGADGVAPLAFSREAADGGDEEALAERARRWREWFQGWTEQPLDRRSTGFSALPDEYFDATAAFVADVLELDPEAGSVLDVGCSSAGVGRRVARRCRRFTGVDATPGLLRDAARNGDGAPSRFLASDGRRLPFPDGAFTAVYCTGVIHTLPSRDDGLRVVRELVRVCRPGGRILVGALPDRGRRWSARAEAWRRGSWGERLRLAAALLLPGPVKTLLRRLVGRAPRHRLVALEYDLPALERHLHDHDPTLRCRTLPFPPDFWSRDFRTTRSNLVIDVPAPAAAAGPTTAEPRARVAAGAAAGRG